MFSSKTNTMPRYYSRSSRLSDLLRNFLINLRWNIVFQFCIRYQDISFYCLSSFVLCSAAYVGACSGGLGNGNRFLQWLLLLCVQLVIRNSISFSLIISNLLITFAIARSANLRLSHRSQKKDKPWWPCNSAAGKAKQEMRKKARTPNLPFRPVISGEKKRLYLFHAHKPHTGPPVCFVLLSFYLITWRLLVSFISFSRYQVEARRLKTASSD